MSTREKIRGKRENGIIEKMGMLMEKNTRGIEFGLYSVGLIGLGIALRTVRPFLRFRKPSDIPSSFLDKNMCFKGRILRVEPSSDSPVLIVEHYPIIPLFPIKDRMSGLPVKLISTDVGPNGLAWMHHLLVGKEINFTLLKSKSEAVQCIVMRDNIDIGLKLVSLGFASVSTFDFQLDKNIKYKKYYNKLLKAESKAEKLGNGMWIGGGSMIYKLWHTLWFKLKRKQPLRISWV